MSDWQPIETAPKDGTRLLVLVRPSGHWSAEVNIARWGDPEPFDEPCWVGDSAGPGYTLSWDDGEISHWMPIPDSTP